MIPFLPPSFASRPWLWGSEEHLTPLFAPSGVTFEFERGSATWDFASIGAYQHYMETKSGIVVLAKERLVSGGRWEDFRVAAATLASEANLATDGSLRVRTEYLVAVGRQAPR